MITGISGFECFWSKNGRFVEAPILIVFWGCVFWAKLSRKTFWTPTKNIVLADK